MGDTVTIMTSPANSVDSLEILETIASDRRTNLRVHRDLPVPNELIDRLVLLAATAPNHRRTFPWRFRIIQGAARGQLGTALTADLAEAGEPEAKQEKARTKYLRAPVMIAVASRCGEDELMTAENRDAVASAIQTLLLGATAAGLASYWSTGGAVSSTRVTKFCNFDPTDTLVGLIYLGWPIGEPPKPSRPAPEIERLGESPVTP